MPRGLMERGCALDAPVAMLAPEALPGRGRRWGLGDAGAFLAACGCWAGAGVDGAWVGAGHSKYCGWSRYATSPPAQDPDPAGPTGPAA